MRVFNIHEAKTHLSRLIAQAVEGEAFVIARAGKPLVKVTALDTPDAPAPKRVGFLQGQVRVPDDFDTMGETEISHLFDGTA
jgi:antitoxin (DNA-binding transcriptional repressor) of toxin-antitoxin stability system